MAAGDKAGKQGAIKSADRVLTILETLANAGRPMTHAELRRRIGMPKSSLTGLLRNLAARKYIERDEPNGGFVLGESAFRLARRGAQASRLVAIASPFVQALTDETGESAALSLLCDDMAERVCGADSPRARFYAMHLGLRAPLYANSSGKIFLAWMTPAEREAYFGRVPLRPLTARTIRSVPALKRQLQTVKSEGVSYSLGEFTPSIVGVAVPVFDGEGQLVAALGLAIPQERFESVRAAAVDALRRHARQIGAALIAAAGRSSHM